MIIEEMRHTMIVRKPPFGSREYELASGKEIRALEGKKSFPAKLMGNKFIAGIDISGAVGAREFEYSVQSVPRDYADDFYLDNMLYLITISRKSMSIKKRARKLAYSLYYLARVFGKYR